MIDDRAVADLAALIERLEKLTSPDREVDDLIGAAVFRTEPVGPFSPGSKVDKRLPRYTASLDAVIALVERELPGWCVISNSKDGQGTVLIHKDGAPYADMPRADSGSQARPIAIAHCLALLHALRAKGGDNG